MPRHYTPRITMTCDRCAAAFEVIPSRATTARFCSLTCKHLDSRQTLTEGLKAQTTRTDSCWLVPATMSSGYGRIGHYDGSGQSAYTLAHQAAWIVASGGPIPDGHFVCHVCDVKNCVRNDDAGTYTVHGVELPRFGHLFLGTPLFNMIDRSEKGRARTAVGTDCHLSKLTEESVRQIRATYAEGGISLRQLAAAYGVTNTTLHAVIHRRTWVHVE
jgi:hypothetical protein